MIRGVTAAILVTVANYTSYISASPDVALFIGSGHHHYPAPVLQIRQSCPKTSSVAAADVHSSAIAGATFMEKIYHAERLPESRSMLTGSAFREGDSLGVDFDTMDSIYVNMSLLHPI